MVFGSVGKPSDVAPTLFDTAPALGPSPWSRACTRCAPGGEARGLVAGLVVEAGDRQRRSPAQCPDADHHGRTAVSADPYHVLLRSPRPTTRHDQGVDRKSLQLNELGNAPLSGTS